MSFNQDRFGGGEEENRQYGGPHASGGGYGGGEHDFSGAAQVAAQHAGDAGDHQMFSNVLNQLQGQQQHLANQPVDEQSLVEAHQNVVQGGGQGGSQAIGVSAHNFPARCSESDARANSVFLA